MLTAPATASVTGATMTCEAGMESALTTTQIGKIGETVVAAQLMLTSGGRLPPFLALADDDGIDLILHDKVSGRSLPIQVKGRVKRPEGGRTTFQFDVRRKTFNANDGAFLLCVLLDMTVGSIERAWLLPMADIPAVGTCKDECYSIVASPKEASADRYTPYRCATMAEVAKRLIAFLDHVDDPILHRAGRLLAMVRELHRAGFERLRIGPGLSPSGLHWRCSLATADNVCTNGWEPRDWNLAATYSTAEGDAVFGWENTPQSPSDMAAKFIATFPDLAESARGPDPAYARWLDNVVTATRHGHLPLLFADFPLAEDGLPPPPPISGTLS
ncbi:MAG TPA: hypothetical protein VK196_22515 [Magnetospirillum sp.]|nr:hypothetical protein [Magnetospirillum sp.]